MISVDRPVVVEDLVQGDHTTLRPHAILAFHGFCLVEDSGDWFMGELNHDGSVFCWASYGPDLAEAIRGL
nr:MULTISPECIES: hypothetical protein [unclassified Streptomyces]